MLEFHFLRPAWLLLVPLLLGLVPLLCRARAPGAAWRRVIDPALLPHLLEGAAPRRRCLPAGLLGLLWILLVLALAGPTWEREPAPLLEARQFHVVLLDLSPSMNAADLAPSRLVRARFEVLDLLRIAGEGQTALVAFGAEPYLVAPLTGDAETIALQVPLLETALLPVAGERRTDLALALAAELLQGAAVPAGSVVLVSDGLSPRAAALEAAASLRSAGHRVHVLGVGTRAGAPLPQGNGGLLRGADGAVRVAQLDEDGLRALAAAGGGLYLPAGAGDGDVQALVAAAVRDSAQGDDAAVERWRDLGPWLVLAALPLALLGFRRGWLGPLALALVVLPPQAVRAGPWDDLWLNPDQQGARALQEGRAGAALDLFERPDWRAAAAHAAGDYASALQALEGLPPAAASYNRGNLLARQGDYRGAIEAYEAALAADPEDDDARHNRDLLRDLLARQAAQQSDTAEQASDAGSADERSEDGQDPSPDAQAGQADAGQDSEGAETGSAGGQEGSAAASDDAPENAGGESGESGAEGSAGGETTSAGDAGAPGSDSGETAGSEASDAGADGESGDASGAGTGSAAGADAAEQGGRPDPGDGGANAGAGAHEDGGRSAQGPGSNRAPDALAGEADSSGAEPGADDVERDGATGGDPRDTADEAGAVDAAAGDELAESAGGDARAGDQEVESAQDGGPSGDDRTQGGAEGSADGDDVPAGAEGSGDAGVGREGDSAGESASDGTGPGEAGHAQAEAAAGSGGEETGRQPGDAPGAAAPGGRDTATDSGSGPGEAGPAADTGGGPAPAATGQGTAAPGLADLLGEGPPAGSEPGARSLPGDGPDERRQALEQMLRTVEDDPGGLLRQRFLLQHLRRSGQLP